MLCTPSFVARITIAGPIAESARDRARATAGKHAESAPAGAHSRWRRLVGARLKVKEVVPGSNQSKLFFLSFFFGEKGKSKRCRFFRDAQSVEILTDIGLARVGREHRVKTVLGRMARVYLRCPGRGRCPANPTRKIVFTKKKKGGGGLKDVM